MAYHDLALCLAPGERLRLPISGHIPGGAEATWCGGHLWDRRSLLLRAAELRRRAAGKITCPASSGDALSGDGLRVAVQAVEAEPSRAGAYDSIGAMLGPGDRVEMAGGTEWSRRDLHTVAFELEPLSVHTCNSLGVTLSPSQRVCLTDGSEWTRQALFARALELDPSCVIAHYNLAAALGPSGCMRLSDGSECNGRSLRDRLLELDPSGA